MHETCKWRNRDISCFCISATDGECGPVWQRQGSIRKRGTTGWQDFLKPQLFHKGKLAALVLLSAPPKICCLRPNRDTGTQGSQAAGDSANPDLSRWTCERPIFRRRLGGGKWCAVCLKLPPSGSQSGFQQRSVVFEYMRYSTFYARREDAAIRCPHGEAAADTRHGEKIMAWFILLREEPALFWCSQVFFTCGSGTQLHSSRFPELKRKLFQQHWLSFSTFLLQK